MKTFFRTYKASIILGGIALMFIVSSFAMVGAEDASTIAAGLLTGAILAGICVLVTFAKLKKLKKAEQEKAAKRAELEAAVAAAAEKRKRKPTPVPIAESSKILFYDLETTGLNAGSDEIIQLAIVDGNGTELINTYIKPQHKRKWEKAEAVNGISPEMVKDAPVMPSLFNKIQELIYDAEWLVGYNNTKFDDNFLKAAGLDLSSVKEYDVMLEYAERYNPYDEYHGNRKWSKLIEAAHRWDYRFPAHDALNDSRATLFIFQKMRVDDAAKNMFYPE
ncbi:MAG: 3'-5' exonuclease [Saccharofermentans sp.]|nr:3'-5' exonuclease [Saccharofermentans sp.]